MSYKLRPAITSEAKPLIGFYSESFGGKTYSALLLAKGYCDGDMSKVAMIETEAGRGEAFADDPLVGGYQVVPIRESFAPKEYGAAIAVVEKAGMRAMIIDSASHEWEGVGGVLSMAASNQEAGKKGPLVWQVPKIQHQREFMLRLMQSPVPLVIVCMRAKYPMYEVTPADVKKWEEAGRPGGKPPRSGEWARSWKLEPKQSDDILFEMFVHGWFDAETHRFHGTKYTREAMREIFPDGQLITVDTGKRLAAWAAGRQPSAAKETSSSAESTSSAGASPVSGEPITDAQHLAITDELRKVGKTEAELLVAMKGAGYEVPSVVKMPASLYERATGWIGRQKKQGALID